MKEKQIATHKSWKLSHIQSDLWVIKCKVCDYQIAAGTKETIILVWNDIDQTNPHCLSGGGK